MTVRAKRTDRPSAVSRRVRRSFALFALLIPLALLLPFRSSAQEIPSQIRYQEARADGLKQEIARLDDQRKVLYTQVRKLAFEIEQLKRGGDLGFLDRRKLDRLQADSRDAGERLEALVAAITKKQVELDQTLQTIYDAYTREMEKKTEQISSEKSRGRIVALTREFIEMQDRRDQYRPAGRSLRKEDFLSVEIQPNETRQSLLAKLDLLRKRQQRVSDTIRNIEKEIRALKKDLSLSTQMESLIKEYNLFDDGVLFQHGPRTYQSKKDSSETTVPTPPPVSDSGRLTGESESGVHISPMGSGEEDRLPDGMSYSIEEEVNRLDAMLRYMRQVQKKLADQINELQERLRKMPNAALPATGKPSARDTGAGGKEGVA